MNESRQTKKLMKKMRLALFAGTVAVALTVGNQAQAQFRIENSDGIAASPRVRKAMAESKHTVGNVPAAPVTVYQKPGDAIDLAASPKVRKQLNELKPAQGVVGSTETVASRRIPNNIAASPKLREQLEERTVQFQIAPLK